MPQNKYKFRNPRRVMPGQKLPDIGTQAAEDKAFRLTREREFTQYQQFFMSAEPNPKSGMRGFHILKLDEDDAHSHGISFDINIVDNGVTIPTPFWEIGMDYVEKDFILAFDHSAADDAGADVVRLSRAEDDTTVGSRSTKFIMGFEVGSPAANTACFTFLAGDTLGGFNLSVANSAAGRSSITITQRDSNHWGAISFDNSLRIGCDFSAANAATLFIRDDVAGAIRLWMDGSGRFGLGSSTTPTATLHIQAGAAAASGAPLKFTSGTHLTTPEAGAMEYNGTELYFTRASARHIVLTESLTDGTNIAVGTSSGTKIGTATNQKIGLWGVTPVIQPVTNSEIRAALIAIGALAGGVNDLNLNGGDLTANEGFFSGPIGGSGSTAFSVKRYAHTFTSDADYTLTSGQADAIVIDVQTDAVLTATRNIIVPTTGSALYVVVNRNAQTIGLKTSGGTAINTPSTRARIIYFPTGVNAFALTASQDYTT